MKTSKWRFFKKLHDSAWYIICENCGYCKSCYYMQDNPFMAVKSQTPNYCENCGCKMSVGDDIMQKWNEDKKQWENEEGKNNEKI